jgi:hypothetical protein
VRSADPTGWGGSLNVHILPVILQFEVQATTTNLEVLMRIGTTSACARAAAIVVVAASLFAGMTFLGSQVSGALQPQGSALSLSTSSVAPLTTQPVTLKVCYARASTGWRVVIEEQVGRSRAWSPIAQGHTSGAHGCIAWSYDFRSPGRLPLRAQLEPASAEPLTTPTHVLLVYARISAAVLFSNVFDCTSDGAVVASGHNNPIVCELNQGVNDSEKNTCRSMRLGLVSTDDSTGQNPDSGTATVVVDQATVTEQSTNFDDNAAVSWNIKTDGSLISLNYSDTELYSNLYVLKASTYGICLSPKGV